MKKKCMRIIAFVMVMMMVLPMATGCGQSKQSKKVVFKVEGQEVYLDEVWFYCKSVQEYYEQYYASMFSSPDVWTSSYPVEKEDGSTEESTLEEVAKRSAIKQIRQVKMAVARADEKKITLTDDEKEEVETQAEDFMEEVTADEKKQMGISKKLAEKIFTDSLKVQKLKEELAKEEGVEISDEEAQTSKIYYIQFPTTVYDSEGNAQEASDENKKEAKALAEEVLGRIQNGEDAATLANAYGLSNSSGELNIDTDSQLPEDIAKAVANLADGETYKEVAEAEDGYYIIQMKAVVDEEATAQKKQTLLESKEQELLNKKFEEWSEKESFDYEKDVDWKILNEIDFIKSSTVTTQQVADATEAAAEESTEIDDAADAAAEKSTETDNAAADTETGDVQEEDAAQEETKSEETKATE